MAGKRRDDAAGRRRRNRDGVVERAREDLASALGADPGSGRAGRDARLRLLRPAAVSSADPDLVRDALGGGGHLPGKPTPSRVRDPASVVRSGHSPDHAAAARPVLAGHLVGGRTGQHNREAPGARRGLVQEAGANLCRLPCCRQADPLGRGGSQPDPVAGGLSDLAGTRTNRRKSAALPAAPGRADVLRRLIRSESAKVRVRVTPKTRNPFTIKALSISGVTWKWHVLNHASLKRPGR